MAVGNQVLWSAEEKRVAVDGLFVQGEVYIVTKLIYKTNECLILIAQVKDL